MSERGKPLKEQVSAELLEGELVVPKIKVQIFEGQLLELKIKIPLINSSMSSRSAPTSVPNTMSDLPPKNGLKSKQPKTTQKTENIMSSNSRIAVQEEVNKTQPKSSIKCEVCSKEFRYKFKLLTHVKFVHINPNSFKCWTCSKTFNYRHLLTNHMTKSHSVLSIKSESSNQSSIPKKVNVKMDAINVQTTSSNLLLQSVDGKERDSANSDSRRKAINIVPQENQCPLCYVVCLDANCLRLHLKRHDPIDIQHMTRL